MRRRCRRICLTSGLALLASFAFASTASAHHENDPNADPVTGCGQVVTANLTLTHAVGPCARAAADGAALKIDNQNTITLDLGGKEVIGCTDPAAACNTGGVPPSAAFVTGEGPGILVNRSTSVTVKNGTVRDFDSGVVVHGGSANTLTDLTVKDNVGTAATSSSYGEGIGIYKSIGNTIVRNTVQGNGPYAGVGLYNFTPDGTNLPGPAADTNGNKVGVADASGSCPSGVRGRGISSAPGDGNTVTDNKTAPNGTSFQDDGVRVEPDVTGAMVDCNVVSGSSLDGIAIFAASPGATVEMAAKVRNNDVSDNGKLVGPNQRKGDGIVIFQRANGCTVSGNNATANGANGIRVDGHSCNVNGNTATGNGQIPDPRGVADRQSQYAYFDLKDGQTDRACGSNATNPPGGIRNYWGNGSLNTYVTRNREPGVPNGNPPLTPLVTPPSYCIQ